jgi:predicted transglutaminase-like cysteine proteinase
MRGLAEVIAASCLCASLSACASSTGALYDSPGMDVSFVPKIFGQTGDVAPGPLRPAQPPSGFVDFCDRNPAECRMPGNAPAKASLTEDLLRELQAVNSAVNKSVQPLDDSVHYGVVDYWTIPSDGYGDCEDFVLAKRKMLSLLGIPAPALRIAVVLTRRMVRHAVLTVATDGGNYVLDSLRDDVLLRNQTDYIWIERQDPASSTGWVSLKLTAD